MRFSCTGTFCFAACVPEKKLISATAQCLRIVINALGFGVTVSTVNMSISRQVLAD